MVFYNIILNNLRTTLCVANVDILVLGRDFNRLPVDLDPFPDLSVYLFNLRPWRIII